ncbi:hypothetical protein NPIL_325541 [Nephila pilipes]|uniref:TIL domain-containing protein n=1 Tax=Nephila pilipes TaxID=299642 RepID=A0A8X6MUQ6_NEPPI|nr:hypothetical protein NPIL_325541 [Nephila pilipes]
MDFSKTKLLPYDIPGYRLPAKASGHFRHFVKNGLALVEQKVQKMALRVAVFFLVFPSMMSSFSLTSGIEPFFAKPGFEGSVKCGAFEEFRRCGPTCKPSCDTLREEVCCEVACVTGCFCVDGFILERKDGPPNCIPLHQCREYSLF